MGTLLVESHVAMICPQTTHFAALLSVVGCRREYVTAYKAPQREQKKLWPSGIGPVRGIAASTFGDDIMRLARDKFQGLALRAPLRAISLWPPRVRLRAKTNRDPLKGRAKTAGEGIAPTDFDGV
jgi:hypothetical protein